MGSDWTGAGRRISRMAEKEGDGMGRRHTVLVVDFGAENCLLLSDMLRGDYNIVEVQDGREAMACLEHRGGEIALMLLDVDAPETGGLAALAAMKKSGYADSVPVIVLSGDDASPTVDQAWKLGAVECVTRPYRAAVVRRGCVMYSCCTPSRGCWRTWWRAAAGPGEEQPDRGGGAQRYCRLPWQQVRITFALLRQRESSTSFLPACPGRFSLSMISPQSG